MKTRRIFIKHLFLSAPLISSILAACGRKKESTVDWCNDLSSLSQSELSTRQQLGYVEQSSIADRTCSNCQLFVKQDSNLACGSCLAMKGPVADEGYCTVWAPAGVGM